MIKVFQYHLPLLTKPVSVFARSMGEASALFHLWYERHAQALPFTEASIVELTAADLALFPQMVEATRAGMVGVGYWIGHREGWVVAPADGDAPGAIAPLDPVVRCYVVTGEGTGQVLVFANTPQRAAAHYEAHVREQFGWTSKIDTLAEMSPWLLTDTQASLRDDMDAGREGIGKECENDCWRIVEPDYDAPLSWTER